MVLYSLFYSSLYVFFAWILLTTYFLFSDVLLNRSQCGFRNIWFIRFTLRSLCRIYCKKCLCALVTSRASWTVSILRIVWLHSKRLFRNAYFNIYRLPKIPEKLTEDPARLKRILFYYGKPPNPRQAAELAVDNRLRGDLIIVSFLPFPDLFISALDWATSSLGSFPSGFDFSTFFGLWKCGKYRHYYIARIGNLFVYTIFCSFRKIYSSLRRCSQQIYGK